MPSCVPRTTLYVAGFPTGVRAKDLAYEFERYGDLVRCDIPAPKVEDAPTSFAFVEFKREHDAFEAQEAMHGRRVDGLRISVQWAKNAGPSLGLGRNAYRSPPPPLRRRSRRNSFDRSPPLATTPSRRSSTSFHRSDRSSAAYCDDRRRMRSPSPHYRSSVPTFSRRDPSPQRRNGTGRRRRSPSPYRRREMYDRPRDRGWERDVGRRGGGDRDLRGEGRHRGDEEEKGRYSREPSRTGTPLGRESD